MKPTVFSRVVWILSLTMDTLLFTSRLSIVDLPAFVGPIRQQRSVCAALGEVNSLC